jgi:hypothetical protein
MMKTKTFDKDRPIASPEYEHQADKTNRSLELSVMFAASGEAGLQGGLSKCQP